MFTFACKINSNKYHSLEISKGTTSNDYYSSRELKYHSLPISISKQKVVYNRHWLMLSNFCFNV